MTWLRLNAVTHGYGARGILNGVSFSLNRGQIGCLMGPSGSGKTTVLLCIAGLEPLRGGSISINGVPLSAPKTFVSPEKRRVGMVFQDFALFPHMSAAANIAFGLRALSPAATRRRVDDMLELCDLTTMRDAYPHELSGGEQQRVALARALATDPDLLLLDEPFSRLDAALHEKLSRQVRDILKSRHQTALMVTHNQNEAFLTADTGGVINQGTICQWDDMDALYHRPNCTFVADFVGDGALLSGRMEADGAVRGALGRLAGNGGAAYPLLRAGDAVSVLLRPDDVALTAPDAPDGVQATVQRRAFRGATTLYALKLRATDEEVISVCPSHIAYAPGDAVAVRPQVRHLILFPALSPES